MCNLVMLDINEICAGKGKKKGGETTKVQNQAIYHNEKEKDP